MAGTADLPGNPGGDRRVGSSVAPCSGTLIVNVHWGNDADIGAPYMKDSRIKVGGPVSIVVSGPVSRTEITETGSHTFRDLPCGAYSVGVAVHRGNALVDRALTHVGQTRWAYANEITSLDGGISLPRNTNKCNFFVYDMIQQVHGSAPTYTYGRGGSWSPIRKTVPALAGSWAETDDPASDNTPGWRSINFRPPGRDAVPPGAILAIAARYADATGHVGIITYPDPASTTTRINAATRMVTVVMPGKTVSAAGSAVLHNDWGFRTSSAPEINSLNSPAAGVEVKQ